MKNLIKLPDAHRNKTMPREKIKAHGELYYWVCDNCHENKFLGGAWVFLVGRYICEECICAPFNVTPVDTKYIKKHIREDLLNGGACKLCNSTSNLEIDHIFPRSRGGKSEKNNLQVLCKSCNSSKGAKIEMV